MSFKILGISGSLRNARRGRGNQSLVSDLMALKTSEELDTYLALQAGYHLENFLEAGRKEKLPFDQMYANLKKQKGDKGLSNSEVALAAALWSAKELGAEIDHVSLSEYFLETSKKKNLEEFLEKLLSADGFIISTPVYFGDRSSLPQSFLNMIKNDKGLQEKLKDKVYAGIAVGAKRNGGQETTLIYQMLDMLNCDMLGVGNDSETTSQYGGTCLAGDIGTMPKDRYGLDTAMGTGRRIARVVNMLKMAKDKNLNGKHRISFWLLQDKNNEGLNYILKLIASHKDIDARIIDMSSKNVIRCLACDICPTHIGIDEEYRCIIKNPNDDVKDFHKELLWADAVIPVSYSAVERRGVMSNYQRFMERTRYLRRGDYVFSDVISAPIVIDEIGSNENMHIRMITSMVRHHTILSKPIIAYKYDNRVVNQPEVEQDFVRLNEQIRKVAKSRLLAYSSGVNHLKYKPVGYVLSALKDAEDEKLLKRSEMIEDRIKKTSDLAKERVS
ncbi:MAG: NAD(P)H-dependent oxidoreductase [Bacteroidota bacterium]